MIGPTLSASRSLCSTTAATPEDEAVAMVGLPFGFALIDFVPLPDLAPG